MNNDEQIEILRKAGFFHDGEDAYSLLAYIGALNIELQILRERISPDEGDPMPQPDDFGPDPEERSLSTAHLEEQNSSRYEDRYGSWDDYDGPDDGPDDDGPDD